MAASFTTTAAAELAGRDLPIHKRQVGTLHSLAYRSIDSPRVVTEALADWNEQHRALALTPPNSGKGAEAADDGAAVEGWAGATEGDELLARLDTLRARQVAPDLWPGDVKAFAKKWVEWKRSEGLVDFTDMIEVALADVPVAPGAPQVGFFDEVQDFTPLELALVRSWGKAMERVVLAGDDDQCLYRFKGATPDAFLDPPLPPIDKKVLDQSWRVPSAVHEAAEAWVRRLTRREPKVYLPREERGQVLHLPHNLEDAPAIVDAVEEAIADGSTAMVLATCAYMLDPVKYELKDRGLPFHNPFRAKRGDWNPLVPTGRGVASKDRLLAYLILDEQMFGEAARLWTGGDLQRWTHAVRTQGIFKRGAKATIEGLDGQVEVPFQALSELFADEAALERAVTPDLAWFKENLLAASQQGMAFPIRVAERHGGGALLERPKVVLGTIHSVKGGQADHVFLLPDLSYRGAEEWARPGESRDAVIRQMYVGMTRARQRLTVLDAVSTRSVPVHELLAGVA